MIFLLFFLKLCSHFFAIHTPIFENFPSLFDPSSHTTFVLKVITKYHFLPKFFIFNSFPVSPSFHKTVIVLFNLFEFLLNFKTLFILFFLFHQIIIIVCFKDPPKFTSKNPTSISSLIQNLNFFFINFYFQVISNVLFFLNYYYY